MIKFFRTIRQNLLNEGKTSKYLKYAIGEILLVVIGILIALQINNWNQDRHQRQKEKKILLELKRDLMTNDSTLQDQIEFYQTTIDEITIIIEHLKKKKTFNDSISLYLKRAMYTERIQFVSSSYESLKSEGIDIISSDKLRSDIVNLFGNEFPGVTSWLRDDGQANANLLYPFYVKYFEFTNESNPFNLGYIYETRLAPDYDNLL